MTKIPFDEKLEKILSEEKWIIDGNYSRTLEARMQVCDTIYFLDFPIEACLAGVESRIGKPRSDMPWIETEFDEEFRQWILDFPKNELPIVYDLLEKYKCGKEVYLFRSRREVDDYFQKTFH